jgi:hypothetical protein
MPTREEKQRSDAASDCKDSSSDSDSDSNSERECDARVRCDSGYNSDSIDAKAEYLKQRWAHSKLLDLLCRTGVTPPKR